METGLTEIDGEKYEQPFLKRFTHYMELIVIKTSLFLNAAQSTDQGRRVSRSRGASGLFHQASVLIENRTGKGQAMYLNLSPVEYWDPGRRFSDYGAEFARNSFGHREFGWNPAKGKSL